MQSLIIYHLSTLIVVQYINIDLRKLQLDTPPLVSMIMNLYYIFIWITQMTYILIINYLSLDISILYLLFMSILLSQPECRYNVFNQSSTIQYYR